MEQLKKTWIFINKIHNDLDFILIDTCQPVFQKFFYDIGCIFESAFTLMLLIPSILFFLVYLFQNFELRFPNYLRDSREKFGKFRVKWYNILFKFILKHKKSYLIIGLYNLSGYVNILWLCSWFIYREWALTLFYLASFLLFLVLCITAVTGFYTWIDRRYMIPWYKEINTQRYIKISTALKQFINYPIFWKLWYFEYFSIFTLLIIYIFLALEIIIIFGTIFIGSMSIKYYLYYYLFKILSFICILLVSIYVYNRGFWTRYDYFEARYYKFRVEVYTEYFENTIKPILVCIATFLRSKLAFQIVRYMPAFNVFFGLLLLYFGCSINHILLYFGNIFTLLVVYYSPFEFIHNKKLENDYKHWKNHYVNLLIFNSTKLKSIFYKIFKLKYVYTISYPIIMCILYLWPLVEIFYPYYSSFWFFLSTLALLFYASIIYVKGFKSWYDVYGAVPYYKRRIIFYKNVIPEYTEKIVSFPNFFYYIAPLFIILSFLWLITLFFKINGFLNLLVNIATILSIYFCLAVAYYNKVPKKASKFMIAFLNTLRPYKDFFQYFFSTELAWIFCRNYNFFIVFIIIHKFF